MGLIKELQLFLEEYKGQIQEEAEHLMEQELPLLQEEIFALYEQTGNRIQYEELYFGRRKLLAVFGLKVLLEQEEEEQQKYRASGRSAALRKLIGIMEEVCEEECWALPAHVNRRHPEWQRTVDLFAAETAQTLAELADRLQKVLPEQLLSKIREQVEHRVLQPFFQSKPREFGWEGADHNWNAVCAGAIGSACLHLMKDKTEKLEKCVERICTSLTSYLLGFAKDGTCMEGLGYFTYGMTYFVNFAQELYEYSEGRMDLFCGELPGLKDGGDRRAAIAEFQKKCYFPDGRTVSFSDGSSKERFRIGLSCVLAEHYPAAELPNRQQAAGLHDDTCYRFAALKMDLLETRRFLEKIKAAEKLAKETGEERISADYKGMSSDDKGIQSQSAAAVHVLPEAQWCIASAANGVSMACKGGHNGEPHNHNDIGHVIYEAGGVLLLTDLGAGEYTREYFGSGRYDILCNSSFGHSVPVIDGRGQSAGREYCARSFRAEITEQLVSLIDEENQLQNRAAVQVEMELAGAYAVPELRRAHRYLSFSLADGSLLLQDDFLVDGEGHQITAQLVTQLLPERDGSRLLLRHAGVLAEIMIEGRNMEDITVTEEKHSSHEGAAEKLYAIRWQVPLREGQGRSVAQVKVLKIR